MFGIYGVLLKLKSMGRDEVSLTNEGTNKHSCAHVMLLLRYELLCQLMGQTMIDEHANA